MAVNKKKLDKVAEAALREFAHHDSASVYSRLRVINAELLETEVEIERAQASLVSARARRARLDAQIRGLTLVVERR